MIAIFGLFFLMLMVFAICFVLAALTSLIHFTWASGLTVLGLSAAVIGLLVTTAVSFRVAHDIQLDQHSAEAILHESAPVAMHRSSLKSDEEQIDSVVTETPQDSHTEQQTSRPPAPESAHAIEETAPQVRNESDRPIRILETLRGPRGTVAATRQHDAVPDWTFATAGDALLVGSPVVLQSQRFATPEEAREDLARQLRKRVQERIRSEGIKSANWNVSLNEIQNMGLIQRECDLTLPLTIGEFTEEVHQVYWQVEIPPHVWRQIQLRDRLGHLVAIFGGATLLIAGAAFVLRRRRHLQPPAA